MLVGILTVVGVAVKQAFVPTVPTVAVHASPATQPSR